MDGRPRRSLVITVRAAVDLPSAPSAPYVVLQLGEDEVSTDVAQSGGINPVWDETIELRLPPPLPNEQPLQVRAKVKERVRLLPDRFVASGYAPLTDLLYGVGRHEVKVPLSDREGVPCGCLHLGLEMEREALPGEAVGSAVGTVLGEVPGAPGPASAVAAAVPGPVLPSAKAAEMQAREVLGAGSFADPSKPGFGVRD